MEDGEMDASLRGNRREGGADFGKEGQGFSLDWLLQAAFLCPAL